MRCSSFRLRALLAVSLGLFGPCAAVCHGAGSPPRWQAPFSNSDAGSQDLTPLGGPVSPLSVRKTQTVIKSNAATKPPTSDIPAPGTPLGGPLSDASDKNANASQPPAALGPTPYDLSIIKKLQVGNVGIDEAPLRVGNLDILAPLVEELPMLGATVTRADLKNVPGGLDGPSDNQYFQINSPSRPPIILTIGKSSAWIDNNQQPLRAAPLVIGSKIYLPVFSIAPLLGAAARLDDQGTLILTPTVQSVELFPIKDTIAITIKTSAPVPDGLAKIVSVKGAPGSSPKVYIDFPGYSMGFDAGNSTIERLVAPGAGDVLRARAGMPSKFPDMTRIVLDLKRPLAGVPQNVPDQTLFALVLGQTQQTPDPNAEGPSFIPIAPPVPFQGRVTSLPRSNSMRGMNIVIDAGHGGHDTGARGIYSDEKNHTLDIAQKLRNYLQAKGANVLMTRDGDYFISLQGRSDFANSRGADLFVSVHINASVNKGSTGTETFYYTAISQSLAREVHKELIKATGRPNRGIAQARFWVIRKTWMPSILTESAFITNPGEEKLLINPAYRDRIARGIAQGIANYVTIYGRPALSG